MDSSLFDELERKVERLLQINMTLKQENELLRTENAKLQFDRNGIKSRIDAILEKLQEVDHL
ncbi:cell division protein ZapB [Geotalea daltonii FRC-32]|uniref:Cell division protein ZapB n=1 Tax=Geotalea daltonii (strain DSM 22248 / JCM 15807 / FRC-32) TaxID=316067 RepID=B9M6E7_GEODF|nr:MULTISPECIES: cell division protein ZapB [Geotalea]ACM21935.1 cell division protein ZapB [Geotalea daltonii FRC-32]